MPAGRGPWHLLLLTAARKRQQAKNIPYPWLFLQGLFHLHNQNGIGRAPSYMEMRKSAMVSNPSARDQRAFNTREMGSSSTIAPR